MSRYSIIEAVALTSVTAIVLASPLPASAQDLVLPDTFAAIDINDDKRVDFTEFTIVTDAQGLTRTRAAQTFIALTEGEREMTEADNLYNIRVSESESWADPYPIDLEGDYVGQIWDVTPNEEVAGEISYAFEAKAERHNPNINGDPS